MDHNQLQRAHNEKIIQDTVNRPRAKAVRNILGVARLRTPMDVTIICECSDLNCREKIKLDLKTYEEVLRRDGDFVLVPGHEHTDIEDVVKREPAYFVVHKIVETAKV